MTTEPSNTRQRDVAIGALNLPGTLSMPAEARGLVVFAHGSGSSRFSPRNRFVAERLQAAGLATLLFDLLTEPEAADRANVFDIPLLGARVGEALEWTDTDNDTAGLPVGLFGSSTGAAAALVAAADSATVAAVVSRGGRPDLAGAALARVRAPTLLIVGGWDVEVLALNREALAMLECEKALTVVPGATHLFEESGTLDQVVTAASEWFSTHLGRAGAQATAP